MNPDQHTVVRTILFACAMLCAWSSISTVSGQGKSAPLDGPQKVEFLLNRLESSPNFKVRIAAASELGQIADGTLADWMVRAFRKESHPAVRLSILHAIGQIPDHRALPPLLELILQELLAEKEIVLAEQVIWNLRSAVDVTEWTKALLDSVSRQERTLAAYLLGLVGGETVFPALLTGISDPSAHVRTRIVQSLGRIGVTEGLPECQRLATQDTDRIVRQAARTCEGELRLKQRKSKLANTRKVTLVKDLRGLEANRMSPDEMRNYWSHNVNPRELEEAVGFLRKSTVEKRQDRSISLAQHKRLLQTIQYDATMITHYRFQEVDLNRLREVVQKNVGYVNQCYLKEVKKDRTLGGTVKTRFLILKSGQVSTVQAVGGSLTHPHVRSCIQNELQRFVFPSIPLSYVTMNYTFSFTPPKDEKFEF